MVPAPWAPVASDLAQHSKSFFTGLSPCQPAGGRPDPNDRFTVLKPQNPNIGAFYDVAKERRT